MSMFKKVGEAIKQANEKAAVKRQQNAERRDAKAAILDLLDLAQLKSLCREFGIGEPSPYEIDFLTGEKRKRAVGRDLYVDRIMDRLKLVQVAAYCDRKRIRISHLLPAEPAGAPPTAPQPVIFRSEPGPNPPAAPVARPVQAAPGVPTLDAILLQVSSSFRPEPVVDELDMQKQLAQWLGAKYPGAVEREVPSRQGKVDIVMFRRYAIELKIAESRQRLTNLMGQLYGYKKDHPNLGVILLDVGAIDAGSLREFRSDYERIGARTATVAGRLHRRKQKPGTTIRIG